MSDNYDIRIGQRLQRAREANNLLQSQVVNRMKAGGIEWSQTTYSKVERGERPLRLQEAEALAVALELDSVADFAGSRSIFASELVKWQAIRSEREDGMIIGTVEFLMAETAVSILVMLESLKEDRMASWEIDTDHYSLMHVLTDDLNMDLVELMRILDDRPATAERMDIRSQDLLEEWLASETGHVQMQHEITYYSFTKEEVPDYLDDADSKNLVRKRLLRYAAYEEFVDYAVNLKLVTQHQSETTELRKIAAELIYANPNGYHPTRKCPIAIQVAPESDR